MHSEDLTSKINLDLSRSPVDISKVEASDNVQSHLSTSYSSKRTRLYANLDAGTGIGGRPSLLSPTDVSLPIAYFHPVHKDSRVYSWPIPTQCIPTLGRVPTRWDRSYHAPIWRIILFLYCCLSCVIGITRFHANFLTGLLTQRPFERPLEMEHFNIKTIEQYLGRSLVHSVYKLEPFVFSNADKDNSSVTICAWVTDMELPLLPKWPIDWHVHSLSLLVITASIPGSLSHENLFKVIQRSIQQTKISGISIHVLHVGENCLESPNPNLYLNLARMLAFTEWTLLFPADLKQSISQKIYDIRFIPSVQDRRDMGVYVFSTNFDGYPFPSLSPLLLQNGRDVWCTERSFYSVSRVSDWSECLWQVSLETTGKLHTITVPLKDITLKEDLGASAEGAMGRRLNSKSRAEMCDAILKQISFVHSRGRYKDHSVGWVKSFCTKTLNKKDK